MRFRYELFQPPPKEISQGPYRLVREEIPILPHKLGTRIWWDPTTENIVEEERDCDSQPFAMLMFDGDGTLLDTEGPYGYFAVCWRKLYQEAGIQGTDRELDGLRRRVYKWKGDLPTSARNMVARIQERMDTDGRTLAVDELHQLEKLLAPVTLARWASLNASDFESDPLHRASNTIADRKERIGQELLAYNPLLVQTLAPFTPGAVDFLKKIPPNILVGIASGSRVGTTILPILKAHAAIGERYPLDRIGSLIVGEENLLGGQVKPHRRYYEDAVITAAHILHREGRIPPSGVRAVDILIIGDRIARTSVLDVPHTRKAIRHLVINAGDNEDNLGPLAAQVGSFSQLNALLAHTPSNLQNPILRRLALTIAE